MPLAAAASGAGTTPVSVSTPGIAAPGLSPGAPREGRTSRDGRAQERDRVARARGSWQLSARGGDGADPRRAAPELRAGGLRGGSDGRRLRGPRPGARARGCAAPGAQRREPPRRRRRGAGCGGRDPSPRTGGAPALAPGARARSSSSQTRSRACFRPCRSGAGRSTSSCWGAGRPPGVLYLASAGHSFSQGGIELLRTVGETLGRRSGATWRTSAFGPASRPARRRSRSWHTTSAILSTR